MDKQDFIFRLVLVVAVAAIIIIPVSMALDKNDIDDRFSVQASGIVYAKPDIANLTLGFQTEVKKTAAEAVNENSEKMNDIIKELKNLDIEAKDIKTTNYNLQPVYDWTESRGQVLRGYRVSQNVTVKIRNLDNISEAIAKSSEKGANQVGSISFTIDDEYELKNQARNEAIEKAKEKARDIADVTGMSLGKIVNVYETQSYYPTPMYDYANAKVEAFGLGGGGVEEPMIEPGQNEVRVEVTVIWEVK